MVETTEPTPEPWVHSADPDAGPCPKCGHKDGGIVVGGETRPHTCCGHPDCMTPEATARADAQASLARLAEAEAEAATEPSGDDRDSETPVPPTDDERCPTCRSANWYYGVVGQGDCPDPFHRGLNTDSWQNAASGASGYKTTPRASLRSTSRDSEVPDLSCPKCGVNSHDNAGEGWTHACDQGFVAALAALPERFTVIPSRDSEVREAIRALVVAVGDYRWEVSPRDSRGTCRLCGATEGLMHDEAKPCGALNVAYERALNILDHSSEAAPTPHTNNCPPFMCEHDVPASEAAPVVGLDVGWLARAMDIVYGKHGGVGDKAAAVAAEYARLTQTRTLGETPAPSIDRKRFYLAVGRIEDEDQRKDAIPKERIADEYDRLGEEG